MKFIADLHIHSKYSRATAKNLDFENLYTTAQIKGITVVGTGDFTHPAWWAEIQDKLVPAEQGLFALKPEIARECDKRVAPSCRRAVRFMLVTEISNIYKKDNRTRKNHNLVFMPNLEDAQRFNHTLDKIGNIRSDGRPILGLDARNLLEVVLESSTEGYLVPAHVWTPWFSLLGSKSGFDSVEACFDDLSEHIFALETGLSSDPPMNWRVSHLDRFTLISNSDAHSPAKLGREANLFNVDLGFTAIRRALETSDPQHFLGTVEFFPEEGKYHVDGHRKCNFRCKPSETKALNNCCPVCGKPLVLGVLYRVEELADRPAGSRAPKAKSFESLIPLAEVLAEVFQTTPKTKKVMHAYDRLVQRFGSEFDILRHLPRQELEQSGIALLGEAIQRMRDGAVHFDAGYDGEFGKVSIFTSEEREHFEGQRSLFQISKSLEPEAVKEEEAMKVHLVVRPPQVNTVSKEPDENINSADNDIALNEAQQSVVTHSSGPLLISAGPGTGKTRTITSRMTALITSQKVAPENILAVTFTNKAAQEMRHRLQTAIGAQSQQMTIATFHGLCRLLLQNTTQHHGVVILDDTGRQALMADVLDQIKSHPEDTPDQKIDKKAVTVGKAIDFIVRAKQHLLDPQDDLSALIDGEPSAQQMGRIYAAYQSLLEWQHLMDFEDLIFQTVRRLEQDDPWRQRLQGRYNHIYVDEFQDINLGQYRLLQLLTPSDGDICVIGDPDQAIYGFRGSDVRFFSQFNETFDHVRCVRLNQNYRSTETILQASYQVIGNHHRNGADDGQMRTYSHIQGDKTICIMATASAKAEAVGIGRTIEQMVGGTGFHAIDFGKVQRSKTERSFSDFAVLYRTVDQGRRIAQVLQEAGIPCQVAGRQNLYEVGGVAKLLALLRVLADQGGYTDIHHLTDLTIPGISRETLAGFKKWAYTNQLPLDQALHEAKRLPIAILSTARQHRLSELVRFIEKLKSETTGCTVVETMAHCVSQTTLADQVTDEQMQILTTLGQPYHQRLSDFVGDLALQSDTDLYRENVEKVTLMTMHASKGLEFEVVFIAGCEDGLIPYQRPGLDDSDMDEERRLFFVAMTRAKAQLYLSWASKRTIFGKTSPQRLSPFVDEVQEHLKTEVQSRRQKSIHQQLSLF